MASTTTGHDHFRLQQNQFISVAVSTSLLAHDCRIGKHRLLKSKCEFRDYLVALGDPRVADPEWLAARIREEQRRARWFEKWFDAWFEESAGGFDFGKEEVRRPVGQPQHPRRTPEERQGAMKAAMPASRPSRTELRRALAPIRSRHSPIPPGVKAGKRRAIGPGAKHLVGPDSQVKGQG